MPRMQSITVPALLFWSICAMAVVGFVQAVVTLARKPPESASPFARSEAPAGFVWALIPDPSKPTRD